MLNLLIAAAAVHAPPEPSSIWGQPPIAADLSLMNETDAAVLRLNTIHVSVALGSKTIWSGDLVVNGRTDAGYEQKSRGAALPACNDPARSAEMGDELRFNLSKSGAVYTRQDEFRIGVTVSHKFPSPACTGIASRSLQLDEYIDLPIGKAVTVGGDGALKVTLKRQD